MCCFSRPVNSVAATRIFSRLVARDRQAVVYQMRLDAPEDLAMILPIPVAQPAADDATTFVNLEKYKELFVDLEKGFPKPPLAKSSRGPTASVPSNSLPLKVHSVGSFDASFVPNIKSFARLDERFRLPDAVWGKLPQYAQYGFAVFKLKQGRSDVHPMAFTFPTAAPGRLFFPTVHIHDGKVHPEEEFDHILYGQGPENSAVAGWTESPQLAREFVKTAKTGKLVDPGQHVYRMSLHGLRKNIDIVADVKRIGS